MSELARAVRATALGVLCAIPVRWICGRREALVVVACAVVLGLCLAWPRPGKPDS